MKTILFNILLFICISLQASSKDALVTLADEQSNLKNTRVNTIVENKRSLYLAQQLLLEEKSIIYFNSLTNNLLFLKEKEEKIPSLLTR